jgi:basic amino acid/polyamine antiporter, APA family
LVYRGVKESKNFSNAMVVLKLAVVGLIILVGGYLVLHNGLTSNWVPENTDHVKSFMPNGFGGVMAAVASVFFAYIGFDAVSVMAEESKNPQRDLPRSMIYSLVICTVIYILLTLVLSGAVDYKNFEGVGDPLAFIFEKQNLDVGWMQFLVSICAVVAMTSVLLVFQMGQPRIWMSMSRDGLLPPAFQRLHKKFKTPSFATIITGLVVGVPILFTDKTFVLDFTSIATLFAFVLVCGGVLLIPRKEKIAGKFNMPYVNGKFIFPAIIIGTIILLFTLANNYFGDKIDFSKERRTDALASIIPATNFDTTSIAQNFENALMFENKADTVFKDLKDSIGVRTVAADKIKFAQGYISNANTEQSRTMKVSMVLFWLLMLILAVLTFIKNYSLIPLLGVASCMYLLTGMTLANWLWFGAWLGLGLIVYFLYGYKKSKLAAKS